MQETTIRLKETDIHKEIKIKLNKLEKDIRFKQLIDPNFNPRIIINTYYPIYYLQPKTLKPHLKKGIDILLKKYSNRLCV
jgi:hypothetical protein